MAPTIYEESVHASNGRLPDDAKAGHKAVLNPVAAPRPFLRRIASSASDFSERERAWAAAQEKMQHQQEENLVSTMPLSAHPDLSSTRCNAGVGVAGDSAPATEDDSQRKSSVRWWRVRANAFRQLLRPGFHHNYSIVFIGAFEFGSFSISSPPEVLQVLMSLVCAYIPFNIFLYGAIYTYNGVTDVKSDRAHPIKRHRPVASGIVSPFEALLFAFSLIVLAMFTVRMQWGDTRLWPLYSCFLAVNFMYSTYLRRIPHLRALVGVTCPLRICLGATLAGSKSLPPWPILVMAMSFMCMVQELKAKLDKLKDGKASGGVVLRRELLWFLLIICCTPFAMQTNPRFVWYTYTFVMVFLVIPVARPSYGALITADVHASSDACKSPFGTHNLWLEVPMGLLVQGDFFSLAIYTMLGLVCFVNRALMELEDILIPAIGRASTKQLVWVIGHPRSGTTSLHSALHTHPDCITGTMYDALFPSVVLKTFMTPMKIVFDLVVKACYDVANHKFGLNEELEEHLWLLHHSASFAVCTMFTTLARRPLIPWAQNDHTSLVHLATEVTEGHVDFIDRCYRRVVWMHGTAKASQCVYVGKPLLFATCHDLLMKRFPTAQVIVCMREPAATIPSFIDLVSKQGKKSLQDKRYAAFLKTDLLLYSKKVYEGLLRMARDTSPLAKRMHFLEFSELKEDQAGVLRSLAPVTKLHFPENAPSGDNNNTFRDNVNDEGSLGSFERKESHKNRRESYDMVPKDKLNEELTPLYEEAWRLCQQHHKLISAQ